MSSFLSKLLVKENKNSLVYFLSSIFGALIGFLTLPLFTNCLSKEDIGIYGFSLSFNAFILPLINLSTETFFLKKYYEQTTHTEKKELLSTLVFFSFFCSIAVILLLNLISPFLFHYLEIKTPFSPHISLLVTSNLFFSFISFILLQYRVKEQVWKYFTLSIFQTLLITGFSIFIVLFLYKNAYGRILGNSIATLSVGGIGILLIKNQISWKSVNIKMIKPAIAFSLPIVFYSLTNMIFDLVDRFFIDKYSNLSDLANFNISFQYASISVLVAISLFRSYEPYFYNLYANQKFDELIHKMNALNLINFLISFVLILISNFIIVWLTNIEYKDSIFISQILIIAFFMKSTYLTCNTILSAKSKNIFLMFVSFLGLGIMVTLNLIFANEYKSLGTTYIKLIMFTMLFLITCFIMVFHQNLFIKYLLNSFFYLLLLLSLVLILNWNLL